MPLNLRIQAKDVSDDMRFSALSGGVFMEKQRFFETAASDAVQSHPFASNDSGKSPSTKTRYSLTASDIVKAFVALRAVSLSHATKTTPEVSLSRRVTKWMSSWAPMPGISPVLISAQSVWLKKHPAGWQGRFPGLFRMAQCSVDSKTDTAVSTGGSVRGLGRYSRQSPP